MFIVLDGIDGAGKGRQREEVMAALQAENIQVAGEEFPVHNSFYENVIHPALQEETTMNASSWVLSYLLDKTLQEPVITPYVNNPTNLFIADGYFTTTIAYQSYLMEQVNLEKLMQYSKDFQIPLPDLAIYIDVDPEEAMKRKNIEEGHDEGLDMFEKSLDKQHKLRNIFQKMVSEQIYCPWVQVDGNREIEVIRDDIIQIIKSKLTIK